MSNTAVMNPELTAAASTPAEKAMRDETVGKTLKIAREGKNLSLDEAARTTKIRKDFLSAIEEDRFEVLPGDVFARGFVRSYADFLGLDGKGIASRAGDRFKDGKAIPAPASVRGEGSKPGLVRLLALGLAGVLAAAAWWLQHRG